MRRYLGFWITLPGALDFRLGSFRKGTSSRTEGFTVSSGYKYPGVRTVSTELPSILNAGTSDVQDVQRDVEVPDCMRAASGSH